LKLPGYTIIAVNVSLFKKFFARLRRAGERGGGEGGTAPSNPPPPAGAKRQRLIAAKGRAMLSDLQPHKSVRKGDMEIEEIRGIK
jgi:hypothetical protein